MDDYSIQSLTESKNEWSARLVSILSFNIIQGINSIYREAIRLCEEHKEKNKYLDMANGIVTLCDNNSYAKGALVLARSLRNVGTNYESIVGTNYEKVFRELPTNNNFHFY